jgi:DNA-binding SARP family transcriptional activator
MLIYLALTVEGHSRFELLNLLWPEFDAERGHANLRHTLYVLRKSLGSDWLEADREFISLKPGADIWSDVDQFHGNLAECQAHGHELSGVCKDCEPLLMAAHDLVRGDFLSGFSLKDRSNFDDWQLLQTESQRREHAYTLKQLVEYHCAQGSYKPAIDFARRWLSLDRSNEEVHCQLMRIYGWAGQRSGVQHQYQECEQVLKEELGISPQPSTIALYQASLQSSISQPAALFGHFISPIQVVPEWDENFFIPGVGYERDLFGGRRGTFVARENELARLNHWAEMARAGHGRIVFITGDAGHGKTTLIQEFARRAQERWSDLIVAWGNCTAYTGEGDPYLPFREILGMLTGDVDALWAAGSISREQARRLWDAFPLVISTLIEAGSDLIHTFLPAASLLRRAIAYSARGFSQSLWLSQLRTLVDQRSAVHSSPEMQQSALLEQYARVMLSLTREHPLLLVLDDLQWADKASLSRSFI